MGGRKGWGDGAFLQPDHGQYKQTQSDELLPVWKLKGRQATTTPSPWVACLKEESADKGEYIDSEDQDGIKGITEEFIVSLARALKDAQQEEKHCYQCSSPGSLFLWLPIGGSI